MKDYGEHTIEAFDWFCQFFERCVPKYPEPKRPILDCIARAAEAAYNADPTSVPYKYKDGRNYPGMPKHVFKELVIRAIAKDMNDKRAGLRQYILEEYNVLTVHHDGRQCRGICIVPNNHKNEHADIARIQGAWGHAHCAGTHETEDFMAEKMNGLQPNAAIERHKMVTLPLPKPGGKKT